jgi:hypothetical protein
VGGCDHVGGVEEDTGAEVDLLLGDDNRVPGIGAKTRLPDHRLRGGRNLPYAASRVHPGGAVVRAAQDVAEGTIARDQTLRTFFIKGYKRGPG